MVALAVGHQRHPPRFHVVATRISLDYGQMIRIQVHPDRSTPPVCRDLHLRQFRGGEYPPTFRITLEAVADSLAERGNSRLLLTMLPSVHRVLRVAPQRRQHLLVSVGKPHVWNHQVLAVQSRQTIRHPQPQRQTYRRH